MGHFIFGVTKSNFFFSKKFRNERTKNTVAHLVLELRHLESHKKNYNKKTTV